MFSMDRNYVGGSCGSRQSMQCETVTSVFCFEVVPLMEFVHIVVTCQKRVTVADYGLCCCVCGTSYRVLINSLC